MILSDDIVYWLAISDKRGVIPHYLLEYIIMKHKSLKKFWYLTKREIMDIGFNSRDADNFIDYTNTVILAKYRDTLDYVKKNRIKIIRYIDDEYPEILKISGTSTHEPPVLLFRKGLKIDFYKSAAIVGTRKASNFALKKTRIFARELASNKFWIISGMARGIDFEAHSGALEVKYGRTIAVLPWMTPITPSSHEDLSKKIIQRGCLLSEKIFHKGKSMKYPYIERNRITSGLSDFVIAVESGSTGGTIRQADFARAQNKPLCTLYPQNNRDPEIMKGFRILVDKGATPIINITDIPDLEKYESVKKKMKGRVRIDPNSKLIFGYDEQDAVKRYLETSENPISEDKLKIIKLEDHETSEDFFSYRYFLLHYPEWHEERPTCPRCGSEHVESRGHTWHCLTCKKYFKKQTRITK